MKSVYGYENKTYFISYLLITFEFKSYENVIYSISQWPVFYLTVGFQGIGHIPEWKINK